MHATIAWEGASSISAGNLTLLAGDIIAVLTGETDKNNLSAMVSVGGTSIASAYPAGWTVHDSSTGTADEWVLRAPCVGDAAQYKYVKLRFYISSTYFALGWQVMEGWDAGSNTPTNDCPEQTVSLSRFPTNSYSNNTLELVATARWMYFRVNLYTGNPAFTIPCIEITRTHPCLEVGSGYLPAVQLSANSTAFSATNLTTYYAWIPRMLDDAGTADITAQPIRCTNNGVRPSTNISNEFDNLSSEIAYDDSNNPSYGIQAILFERRDLIGQVCGDSTASDVHIMQGEVVAGFEDLTLHTLDATDDSRCMWLKNNNVTTHGNIRLIIQAE